VAERIPDLLKTYDAAYQSTLKLNRTDSRSY
jgi:hypothetical protein